MADSVLFCQTPLWQIRTAPIPTGSKHTAASVSPSACEPALSLLRPSKLYDSDSRRVVPKYILQYCPFLESMAMRLLETVQLFLVAECPSRDDNLDSWYEPQCVLATTCCLFGRNRRTLSCAGTKPTNQPTNQRIAAVLLFISPRLHL